MKQLALIFVLAFAVSACASTRAADVPMPQSKSKTVAVAKAKPKAVTAPVKSASQPAATQVKPQKNKTWKWYAPWRKKDG